MSISRLAKLKAMPLAEIAHRLKYAAFTAYERQEHRRGTLASQDRLFRALGREWRDGDWRVRMLQRQGGRFFAWEDDPQQIRALFHQQHEAELAAAREMAASVSRHEIGFFGETFHFGPTIDWHADPITKAPWPVRYHRDVPVNGGNVGYGDVKHVWELNRHQFFVDLAKVAFLDESRPHAAALGNLLRSWTAAVPYATGAPWACALEPAFRAWSWMWAYHLVRRADLLDDDVHLEWITGFFDHGRFLHRHLETYSSPYNHLIGEASALFALGVLFPEFREAPAWVRRGQHVLESTVASQFHHDGGSVEQSAFYHHATLGFYLLSAVLGQRNGIDLSPGVWRAIERGLEFSAALMQPNGRLPRIGGADDGKPIRMEHLPFWDFRPYHAIGAVLFSRGDFRFVAGRFGEDALWVLGPDAAQRFDRIEPQEPARAQALPASGYYIVRSDWSASADYLCLDCGEQAAGLRRDEVPSAAHGHADCLSAIVALGGHEVLVDPGFFCYNGDPQWEVHFRKTRAHNTVSVDGHDQARHVAKMAWVRTYEATPEAWSADQKFAWVVGRHDGFQHDGHGVRHRRTAWLRTDGYVVIRDELTGTPGHHAQAVFQFAPGVLSLRDHAVLFDDRFEMAWVGSTAVRATVTCGGESPAGGWIAPSLGVRRPAPRLELDFEMDGDRVVLLTVLADRYRQRVHSDARVSASRSQDFGLLSARVNGDGWVDEIAAAATAADASTAAVQTDAPLAILRRSNRTPPEALQAGGTFARLRRGHDAGDGVVSTEMVLH
ncbi:MAG TPA: alginate lyase family protein [Vicinamibacterales bacterium]|nr:alginate lyase family protein [Vicinamibacterales bacterium]